MFRSKINKRIGKVVLGIVVFIMIAIMLIPNIAAFAEDGVGYPGQEVEIVKTVLTVNGEVVEPDEGLTGNGNYTIDSDSYTSVAINGEDQLNSSLTFQGVGPFVLTSDFDISGQITVLGGEFYTNDKVINAGSFYVGLYKDDTKIYVELGNSEINVFAWAVRGDGVVIDAGTSTINSTLMFDNSLKTGRVYNNVNLKEKVTVSVKTEYVPREEVSEVNGEVITRTVYDPVTTTSESTVYGFVEGNSSFNNFKVEDADKVYVTSSSIKTVSTEITKGVLSPVTASKVSIITKGALDTAKADTLKDVVISKDVVIEVSK